MSSKTLSPQFNFIDYFQREALRRNPDGGTDIVPFLSLTAIVDAEAVSVGLVYLDRMMEGATVSGVAGDGVDNHTHQGWSCQVTDEERLDAIEERLDDLEEELGDETSSSDLGCIVIIMTIILSITAYAIVGLFVA
jgi:hypothetical protein